MFLFAFLVSFDDFFCIGLAFVFVAGFAASSELANEWIFPGPA